MAWWIWAIAGIALLAFEVLTPGGLFALFFGAGALLVAPLAAFGLDPVWQWLLFSVASLASLAFLRGPLLARIGRSPDVAVDALVGEEVVHVADVPPGGEGKAELRGVPWPARAAGGAALRAGQRCRVERVEGVTLWVRAQ
jgi:membrane protein implicated in regulation of membrane protease activity